MLDVQALLILRVCHTGYDDSLGVSYSANVVRLQYLLSLIRLLLLKIKYDKSGDAETEITE